MSSTIRTIELVVLGLATWPVVRLATHVPLYRHFPAIPILAAIAIGVWVGAIALLAGTAPVGLHVLAAIALAGLGLAVIRARTGFRPGRPLPPGSLSLVDSVRALAERSFYLEQAERHGPIFKTAQFSHKVVCVVGLGRGHKLLREHSESIGPSPQPFTREISGGFLRYMEGGTYKVYGPLFRKAFASSVTEAARPVVVEATRHELNRAAADSLRSPAGGVRPGPYLERIVRTAFLRALFGAEPRSEEALRLEEPLRVVERQNLAKPLAAETHAALAELRETLGALAAADAGRELPTSALGELRRIDPRMPDDTCLDNLVFTHRLATANVASLLHWVLAILGRSPDWRARARRELVEPSPGQPGLAERIVLETLRLAQSEYLYKRIEQDLEFDGYLLPAGWLLRVCVWESHRDDKTFADPAVFDPDRFRADFTSAQYSPFGWGKHACNGVPLAMLVSATLVEELALGFEWSVSKAVPAEREPRHWSHWRPNSRMELMLAPIAQAQARGGEVAVKTARR